MCNRTSITNLNDVYDSSNTGYYWIDSTKVYGTQPYSGYYILLVFKNLQVAYNWSGASMKYRMYVNSTWGSWLDTSNLGTQCTFSLSGTTLTITPK